jgi:outer membrane protein TolC
MAYRIRIAALALAALAAPAAAQQLSIHDAQALATAAAPQLIAQSAAVRAARASSGYAQELPDPRLIAAIENVPTDGADKWSLTRDGMTMRRVGVMQEFPREEKRRLRGERAEAEARREEAALALAESNLRRDVAVTWVEAWSAERQLALLRDLARESDLGVTSAQAALAGGRGTAAEPLAARLAAAQVEDRIIDARRMVTRAREQLARWIGRDAQRPLEDAPDFSRLPVSPENLLAELEHHPHVAMFGPMQAMADAEVKLADAARRPDWSLELTYGARGSAYSNMLSLEVRVDLPLFEGRRQGPATAARVAAAEQVRSQAEDARRAHLAEVRVAIADWQAALERAQRIESTQLPLAQERLGAATAAYSGGRGELMPVLEARRADVETRMTLLQARSEAGRAWAQLAALATAHESTKDKP